MNEARLSTKINSIGVEIWVEIIQSFFSLIIRVMANILTTKHKLTREKYNKFINLIFAWHIGL